MPGNWLRCVLRPLSLARTGPGGASGTEVWCWARLGTAAPCSIGDVGVTTSKPVRFQLYVMRDRGLVAGLIARASVAGGRPLTPTVDRPIAGLRHRDAAATGVQRQPGKKWIAHSIGSTPRSRAGSGKNQCRH
ncbi:alpha-hydroxy-acid oxidizing protein [Variovorax sp. HW608]|uniref:alpha-hydroxy-acid oxidizing protein n=1 Tax=Variovorax sp. HW608 TaxID=1034889 RepID=UPI000B5ACF4B